MLKRFFVKPGIWGLTVCLILLGNQAMGPNGSNLEPSYQAFQRGEVLKYRIHYGMVSAGKATFKVRDTLHDITGKPHYAIKVFGRSLESWEWFYKVRDHYYSYVDTKSKLPSVAYRNVREGSHTAEERLIFKRDENKLIRNGEVRKVPSGIHDIVSAIYYSRCIDFSETKPGTFIPIKTFFADSLFPLGMTYKGKETIATNKGTFRCRIFKPELVEGRVFKGQDDMTVYVSDDRNQVPIRIESDIFVGKIQADLKSYQGLKFPLKARIE